VAHDVEQTTFLPEEVFAFEIERKYWAKVACWGQPGFFKVALDSLSADDPVVPRTWQTVQAWLKDKLEALWPLTPTYLPLYRRYRPWLQ
jgi:hypothetical protein